LPDAALASQLQLGLAQLNIDATPAQIKAWLEYIALLAKWNRAYNLTAVTDPLQMVSRHVLDSLSIAPHLQGKSFIDVGTGAGLPGIPLAILFPQRHFTLLDAAGKRTRFLTHVKAALKLDNINIVNSRVEAYQPAQKFDGVLSRAFASLNDMLEGCAHLCTHSGRFYAMKGQLPADEITALPTQFLVEQQQPLTVPFEPAARHLIILTRHAQTN